MGYGRFDTPALENYLDILKAKIKKVEEAIWEEVKKPDRPLWADKAWSDLEEITMHVLSCTEHKRPM